MNAQAFGQEPDGAAVRRQADAAENLGEAGGFRCDDHVAAHGDGPADTDGRAADGGDDRFLDGVQGTHIQMAAAGQFLALAAQVLALHAADIGAGAERSAFPGDDDRSDRVVEAEFGEMFAQLLAHFPGQRVQPLRPVQDDFGDSAFDAQIDWHVRIPPCDFGAIQPC